MKVKSQYASKQLLRLWQTCLSLRRQRRLRWDCPTATSQEERGGLGQRRMAVRKGRVLLRSLGLCANMFSKKLIWKGRGFLLVGFYLGKKPLKVYLCRMGACWLSTARVTNERPRGKYAKSLLDWFFVSSCVCEHPKLIWNGMSGNQWVLGGLCGKGRVERKHLN